jgi:hypothetical protein
MFEPVRGGTRGGQAEFKWSDVSADKDREVLFFFALPLGSIRMLTLSQKLLELPRSQHQRTYWPMAEK